MSATDISNQSVSLVQSERKPEFGPMERATSASVRKLLLASAVRARNLAIVGTSCISAFMLLGFGMGWLGLATLGVGALAYATLIARDAVDDRFLCETFSIRDQSLVGEQPEVEIEPEPRFSLIELDESLRMAYEAVLSRQNELQNLLRAGPAILQSSLSEGDRICENLLASARKLVKRGQLLRVYLKRTSLTDLSNSACEAVLQVEATNDQTAARTYRMIVSGRQGHMETHIEVEGLYDRVLAQLILIETTLAGAVAKLVKITAADDEESALTASLVNEELEHLMSDVHILETSMEEVAQTRPSGIFLGCLV